MASEDPIDILWDEIEDKLDNVISKKLDDFIGNCNSQLQSLHDRMDNFAG